MASANGTLTPPSLPPAPTSPSLAKRKRSEADNPVLANGASAGNGKIVNGTSRPLKAVVGDILSILKSYDTQPSILSRPISSSATRAASGESETKRTKLTPPKGSSTIASLAQDGSYTSLEALEQDVDNATSEVLSTLDSGELAAARLSPEQIRLQTKTLAFQQMARTLIAREQAQKSFLSKRNGSAAKSVDKDADAENEEPAQLKEEEEEDQPEGRTVLTLYGQASGPKQLFSSLQQPVSVSSANAASRTSVKVTLPLRESTLPNIITTTQVYPIPDESEGRKKKTKTLGDVFGAPSHLPQLSPPKPARPQTAKGNTVTFAPPEAPKTGRKGSNTYSNQNLSTGHWLGYGGVDVPKDPTSPTAKQKSRQRALSTGEAQLPPSEDTLAKVQQAKEDALFRSAYSSFAPSRDDAMAIVPEETKNKVWWQKVGEKRFNETFPIDPELLSLDDATQIEPEGIVEDADQLKIAVESFSPVEEDPFQVVEKSDIDKSTDEILEEISELIETLASHQRIRNSSLATNPRTPVIQNSSLASLAGSPSTPSTEEIDVYQMLKSQLTLMIATLPPYAVAKLNGNQLDELNISRTIVIETEDHKGVLEEDQYSRRAAVPAAAAPPSLSRMASAGSAAHTNFPPSSSQFARTPSMHSSSARPSQATPSYFPQQQSVHRSPSVHYQRSSSGASQPFPPAPAYSGSTSRPNFPTAQYGQQTPRPSYGQATPGQYYSQRPAAPQSNYGGVGTQFYQQTPQTQSHRYPQQQGQNGYYQQRSQNASSYNYNAAAASSPHARTSSPLKANPAASQPGYHSSRPAGYSTPGSGGQMRSTYYPPSSSQFGTPQGAAATAPMGYNNPQQMMLDRQQAQQPQARMAAQNSFHRHGSGTPQPPNPQYGSQQQPNGTPMAT